MNDDPVVPPAAPASGDAPPADPPAPPAFKAPQTQEEFDRMLGPRLQREREKFADYDDLKAKAARLATIEQENETETERLRREATEATRRAEGMAWTLADQVIRSAVTNEAAKAGAVDVDAVITLLDKNAVTIDDAGRVTGADTAVAELLAAKPYLKGAATPSSFDGGARGNGTGHTPGRPWQVKDRSELSSKSPDEINTLREGGHLDDLLGVTTRT